MTSNKVKLLFIILIPFIQTGFTYYLSIQTLLLASILFFLKAKSIIKDSLIISLILLLMISSSIFIDNIDANKSLLINLREFLCLFFIIWVINSRINSPKYSFDQNIENAFVILIIFLFFISFIQFILFPKGILFILPEELYISNTNTIATQLDLEYGYDRPPATFGEPSYLGFITLSLLVILLKTNFNSSVKKNICQYFLVGIIFLSKSASALFIFISIYIIFKIENTKRTYNDIAISIFYLLIILLIFSIYFIIIDSSIFIRIINISNASIEKSGYGRLILPFKLIDFTFSNYPLGTPREIISSVFLERTSDQNYTIMGLDNGFLNLFIFYGYTSLLIISMLLFKLKNNLTSLFYILFSSMFNGAFLAFDKTAIICFVLTFTLFNKNYKKIS